jgi:hypothetical protein
MLRGNTFPPRLNPYRIAGIALITVSTPSNAMSFSFNSHIF